MSFAINTYERETTEMVVVSVMRNKLLVTTNVFLAVIDSDLRPIETDWVPATVTANNKCGILISTLAVGTYSVWVRVVESPEDAIFRAGTARII